MKNTIIFLVSAAILLTIFFSVSFAHIPKIINYQGKLTDAAGLPLTGVHTIHFGIFDVETGGMPLWTESHESVTVTNGLFNVLLGDINKNLGNLDFDKPYYLGVMIDSNSEELTPRKPITSVAYAMRAENANTAANLHFAGEHNYRLRVEGPASAGIDIVCLNGSSNIRRVSYNNDLIIDPSQGSVGIGDYRTEITEKLEVMGNVKANAFIGNGSQLTGILTGIEEGTITTDKIADGTVTAGKIAEDVPYKFGGGKLSCAHGYALLEPESLPKTITKVMYYAPGDGQALITGHGYYIIQPVLVSWDYDFSIKISDAPADISYEFPGIIRIKEADWDNRSLKHEFCHSFFIRKYVQVSANQYQTFYLNIGHQALSTQASAITYVKIHAVLDVVFYLSSSK